MTTVAPSPPDSPNPASTPASTPAAQAALAAIEPATYTVSDLAHLLSCSERHIWRQLDLGRIPGVIRCGRLVRLSKRIIDDWLAGR
jgi:excisionase family DNA binding protein